MHWTADLDRGPTGLSPVDANQLAVFKIRLTESRMIEFGQAQITVNECAVIEFATDHMRSGKITA